jgi:hypothetical protein
MRAVSLLVMVMVALPLPCRIALVAISHARIGPQTITHAYAVHNIPNRRAQDWAASSGLPCRYRPPTYAGTPFAERHHHQDRLVSTSASATSSALR